MLREVDLKDISDGRLYMLNDMVKADTGSCSGCHKCCTGMGSSIVLDPFDVYRLKRAMSKSFNELLEAENVELNIVDGLILPNICMGKSDRCSFLNEQGRCSIHTARPGICRLFPLGRVYENDGFKYFLQSGECISHARTKIKVKKWVDTPDTEEYDRYILEWHKFIRATGQKIIDLKKNQRPEHINDIAMYVLNEFYVKDIDMEAINEDETSPDFHKQLYKQIRKKIILAKNAISRM